MPETDNPIVIIPARMASNRLPGKPLADIGGTPMIVQVIRRAQEAGVGDVVVACDGQEIAEAVAAVGGRAVITDPDLPSGSDRVWQALQEIDPDGHYDIVINLQGDMPTLDPDIVRQALDVLEDDDVDIATLAAEITNEEERDNPAVVKVVIGSKWQVASGRKRGHDSLPEANKINRTSADKKVGNALYFSRLPVPYGAEILYHHIGIYAYRRQALEKFVNLPPSPLEQNEKLEQLRALEAAMRIDVAVVDTVPLGVDTPQQLEQVRKLL